MNKNILFYFSFYHNIVNFTNNCIIKVRYSVQSLSSFFTDSPRSTLTVTPDSPVFSGETVNLKCVIESHSDWRYEWYKDSTNTPVSQTSERYTVNGDTLSIVKAITSDGDQYWCRGERDGKPDSSLFSSAVSLSVKGELNIIVLLKSL